MANSVCIILNEGAGLVTHGCGGVTVMKRAPDRLVIINDQHDFARRIAAIAERRGLSTRIIPHTLDFVYLMENWLPQIVAVQMAMADRQDVEVLERLENIRFPGHVLLTGDVPVRSLEVAAKVARDHGLRVASVLTRSSSSEKIEGVLRHILGLERAALMYNSGRGG
jgi:hypothetical protein